MKFTADKVFSLILIFYKVQTDYAGAEISRLHLSFFSAGISFLEETFIKPLIYWEHVFHISHFALNMPDIK